jgi:hypothetical protein
MATTYTIHGMTCGNCVAKIKTAFGGDADVTLSPPRLILAQDTGMDAVNATLAAAGKYSASKSDVSSSQSAWFATYRPLFLIVGYISVASFAGAANIHDWMLHFMAGFFLVFSFFKMLDIRGFADAYAGYDLLAARWKTWGLIYPFVELFLGLAFLFKIALFPVLLFTILLMGFSSIGVIRAVVNKQKIRCACLGTSLNLPMSTITIVEDLGMVLMSILMLASV